MIKFKCIGFWLLMMPCMGMAQKPDLVRYVNTLAGTASSQTPSALKHGSDEANFANTIPSVCTPFAMTQWTPQTQATEKKCIPPYYYKDDQFKGFRGSHWISGSCMQDYGSVTIMPITGRLKTKDVGVTYSHADEVATPYLYKLSLPAYQISTSVTATPRCGMMEVASNKADSLYLLITPNSDFGEGYIKVNAAKGEIYGYNPVHRIYQGWGKPAGFSGYFIIKIDKPIGATGTFEDDKISLVDSIAGKKNIGAYVGFKMAKGEKIHIRIGTSFSSLAGARKNLDAELPAAGFDKVVAQCKATWQQALGQMNVTTANVTDKRIFYTAFYHSMQQPRMYNDVDGTYPRFSSSYQLANTNGGNYYDDLSLWDIYRAQIPLYEILRPDMVKDLVRSVIAKGEQGGWLPIFPCWNSYTSEMIGDHTTSIISSAYLKGISTADQETAYRLMRKNAFELPQNRQDYLDGKGRRALASYLKYGYIPMEDDVPDAYHKKEQVSRTLEYAYDDHALALMARKLNHMADEQLLTRRAKNYVNVFDPSTGFVRGRMKNGDWIKPFDPDKKQNYITEGTPRQYTFYVPHDVPGLYRLMGGRKRLEYALDSLFIKGEYWHGNEPGHQIPFMYNFTASSWKTQKQVKEILSGEYSDGPGGLGGNDDAGQMSAWYMFAAMGFYPVNPVSGEYLLCSPIFDHVTVALPNGKNLQIITHKRSARAIYIGSVKINNKPYTLNYIKYADIMKGAKMDIYLQDVPNKKWGAKVSDQPVGMP